MSENKNFEVKYLNIDEIIPYDNNVKIHDEKQIESLANNIQRFGFDVPIVVDKNNVIIKGHGRRLASIKLGLNKVPVIVREDLSQEEVDAARITDNRVVSTEYDIDGMQDELRRLSTDFNFQNFGFEEREVNFSIDNIDIEGYFVDDIVDESKKYEEQMSLEEEDLKTNIVKLLGFKEIDSKYDYVIVRYIDECKAKYKLSAADSFCEALKNIIENKG